MAADTAELALAVFEDSRLAKRYPAIAPGWRRAWNEVTPVRQQRAPDRRQRRQYAQKRSKREFDRYQEHRAIIAGRGPAVPELSGNC